MISSLTTTRFVVQFSPHQERSTKKFDKNINFCWLRHLYVFHPSVPLLTIKISQSARENLLSYCKICLQINKYMISYGRRCSISTKYIWNIWLCFNPVTLSTCLIALLREATGYLNSKRLCVCVCVCVCLLSLFLNCFVWQIKKHTSPILRHVISVRLLPSAQSELHN